MQLHSLLTSRSIYFQIEAGTYNIFISELIAVAEIFHTDFNTIFNGLTLTYEIKSQTTNFLLLAGIFLCMNIFYYRSSNRGPLSRDCTNKTCPFLSSIPLILLLLFPEKSYSLFHTHLEKNIHNGCDSFLYHGRFRCIQIPVCMHADNQRCGNVSTILFLSTHGTIRCMRYPRGMLSSNNCLSFLSFSPGKSLIHTGFLCLCESGGDV